MTTEHFRNNDLGYHKWIEAHPNGFVANYRKSEGRYIIHFASCGVLDLKSRTGAGNPKTGGEYEKYVSVDMNHLVKKGHGLKLGKGKHETVILCQSCLKDFTPTEVFEDYVDRADALFADGYFSRPDGQLIPVRIVSTSSTFSRDPKVRSWTLFRSRGHCELCRNKAPFETERNGKKIPFLETHHIQGLADGGPDTPNNTAAVCPNCHRNLHFGLERIKLCEELSLNVAQAEKRESETHY